MNVATAIADAVKVLSSEATGPPRMAADTLLMFVLGCDRAYLHAHPERELSASEESAFAAAVRQRASGRPLQYITGKQEFWGLEFTVTPDVLIPRPESEHLVEEAVVLAGHHGSGAPRICDVGTGSGCIAIAVAYELRRRKIPAEIHATDISTAALEVARQNASRLGFADIHFHQADLLDKFSPQEARFDLVLSNPPYVGLREQDKVQREVREHEPQVAVFAGEDGLAIYKRLVPEAHSLLQPGGWLLLEIGYSIEAAVRALLPDKDWQSIRVVPDLQGIPRVVMAQKENQ